MGPNIIMKSNNGACVKAMAKEKFENWMEKVSDSPPETNWEKWERNALSASDKRVLSTWLFGEAWEDFCSKKYMNMRRSAFEKGGCGIAASGKNDHLIRVENHGPVWPPPPGTPFDDDEYLKHAWTKHPGFKFSDKFEPDEKDEDVESPAVDDPVDM